MEINKIIQLVKNFGLGEYEAKVFTYLNILGPSKATEISKASGVPQSKIYEVLDSLISKNLVQIFETKPKIYKAVSFKEGLEILIEMKMEEIAKLKVIANQLKSFATTKNIVNGGIWSSRSKKRAEFFKQICKMARRCKKYMFGVSRDFSRFGMLDRELKKAVKRGVKVYLIGMQKPVGDALSRAIGYAKLGVEVRIFETKIHPRIALIDGKEILFRLDSDPYQKEGFHFNYFWSNDPSLVRVFDEYLKTIWSKAKKLNLNKHIKEK